MSPPRHRRARAAPTRGRAPRFPPLSARARSGRSEWILPGIGDAGAHVSQIMDSGWTSFLLSHWYREHGVFTLAEAVRKMTSAQADRAGLRPRPPAVHSRARNSAWEPRGEDPRGQAHRQPRPSNGSRCGTPILSKCFRSRVTTTRFRSSAVAAIRPSTAGTGSRVPSVPQRSAMALSTPTIRSRNSIDVRVSQPANTFAVAGSLRRTRSTPRRSSPMVRTLRNSSPGRRCRNQATTLRFARRLRSSDTTFVSRR